VWTARNRSRIASPTKICGSEAGSFAAASRCAISSRARCSAPSNEPVAGKASLKYAWPKSVHCRPSRHPKEVRSAPEAVITIVSGLDSERMNPPE